MNKENKYNYISKYKKQHIKRYIFEFNKNKEQDLIDHLEAQPSKNGYVRKLIKEDMQK